MKKLKLLTSMLLTLVLIVSLTPMTMAAKEATIGPDTKGTITITLRRTDGKTLVPNVNVTLHQVGVGRFSDNNLYFDLQPVLQGVQDKAGAEVTLDGLTAAQNTANAAALKSAISKLSAAEKEQIPTWKVKTGEDGTAVFGSAEEGLSVGVYLVQSQQTGGYKAITPFLIYLPMTETDTEEDGTPTGSYWETDVAASPKVSYSSGGGGGTKPEDPPEDIPDDPPPLDPGQFPEEDPDLEEIPDEEPPLAILPQTGLLQWPIPVMAMAGLLLVALGLLSEQRRKARNG